MNKDGVSRRSRIQWDNQYDLAKPLRKTELECSETAKLLPKMNAMK